MTDKHQDSPFIQAQIEEQELSGALVQQLHTKLLETYSDYHVSGIAPAIQELCPVEFKHHQHHVSFKSVLRGGIMPQDVELYIIEELTEFPRLSDYDRATLSIIGRTTTRKTLFSASNQPLADQALQTAFYYNPFDSLIPNARLFFPVPAQHLLKLAGYVTHAELEKPDGIIQL